MNEHAPLTPDDIDVLLSAELDGDLDAAAADLGLSAGEARSQLDAVPGIDARRQALTRASELIAVAPALDSDTAERLVAAALAPDALAPSEDAIERARQRRRERGWRVLVAAGSVAAAIAVIVGIASIKPSGDSSKASSAAPETADHAQNDVGSSTTPRPASPISPDLGDVTTNDSLRVPARRLLANVPEYATGDTSKDAAAHPSLPQPESTSASGLQNRSQSGKSTGDLSFAAAKPRACTAQVLGRYRIRTAPTVIARGTVSGAPVAVLIFRSPTGDTAYVVRVSDCTLLRRQSLG